MQKRIAILIIAWAAVGCKGDKGEPLLSTLLGINSKTVVILKATYASDSPLEFSQINNNALFTDADDTGIDVVGLPAYAALPIYIDIGEIRLSTKNFGDGLWSIDSAKDAKAFWDVLASERQVYCSQPYSTNLESDSCFDTGGIVNYQELMNGRGAVFPSRDVGPGVYLHAGIFVRAIATGHARVSGTVQSAFFDNTSIVDATNITPYLQYDPAIDDAMRQVLPPQTFPLHFNSIMSGVSANSMFMSDEYTTRVVELRFNLKENLMVHGLNDTTGFRTMVSVSDWRRAHALQRDVGGSLLMRARVYYPDYVNDLTVQGGTSSTRHYYAVIDPLETFVEDNLPVAATPVRSGSNLMRNLTGGVSYILQCRYDANNDGYPESVLGQTPFSLLPGPGSATIACSCGGSTTAGCQ
jgi:hypothetical protein